MELLVEKVFFVFSLECWYYKNTEMNSFQAKVRKFKFSSTSSKIAKKLEFLVKNVKISKLKANFAVLKFSENTVKQEFLLRRFIFLYTLSKITIKIRIWKYDINSTISKYSILTGVYARVYTKKIWFTGCYLVCAFLSKFGMSLNFESHKVYFIHFKKISKIRKYSKARVRTKNLI